MAVVDAFLRCVATARVMPPEQGVAGSSPAGRAIKAFSANDLQLSQRRLFYALVLCPIDKCSKIVAPWTQEVCAMATVYKRGSHWWIGDRLPPDAGRQKCAPKAEGLTWKRLQNRHHPPKRIFIKIPTLDNLDRTKLNI